jgi:hypothetical protein
MASSSAPIGVETFAPGSSIKFGSLDFLAATTGEPRLVHSGSIPSGSPTSGTPGIARAAPKTCEAHHDDHQPSPVAYEVAIIDHQPVSTLDTYEDGPSRRLTEEV